MSGCDLDETKKAALNKFYELCNYPEKWTRTVGVYTHSVSYTCGNFDICKNLVYNRISVTIGGVHRLFTVRTDNSDDIPIEISRLIKYFDDLAIEAECLEIKSLMAADCLHINSLLESEDVPVATKDDIDTRGRSHILEALLATSIDPVEDEVSVVALPDPPKSNIPSWLMKLIGRR